MKNKQRIQRNIPPAIAAHRVSCCVAAALILIWCVLLIIPPTRSFAVQLLGICGFYGVCIGMLRLTSLWSAIRSLRAKSVAAIAAASITAAVFYAWYFSLYHYYPTWDRINYWSMTIRFNAETSTSLVHTIKDVYWSINNSDYNDLLSWVAALPTRLAPQWTATFFVLTILFLLPASFIITMFVYMHAAASTQRQTMVLVTIYAGILCLSAFIRPVLIGYDDVVVLLLFVIVLAGVFDSHMLHSVPLRIMLGIGLAGTFLLRRWFIYACLGLAVTAIIYWGCRIALTVANNRRDLLHAGSRHADHRRHDASLSGFVPRIPPEIPVRQPIRRIPCMDDIHFVSSQIHQYRSDHRMAMVGNRYCGVGYHCIHRIPAP